MANILTYQQLLTEAREILQDTDTDPSLQRYSDQTLVNIFNRGFQELYRVRPDAFYDLWDDTTEDFDVPVIAVTPTPPAVLATGYTDWTTAYQIPMMFWTPMVDWVIGITESIDDEFSDDSRSMQFIGQFKEMVSAL